MAEEVKLGAPIKAPVTLGAPVDPRADDAFKRFGVSPNDYDYDPKTDTISRKPVTLGSPIQAGQEPDSFLTRHAREAVRPFTEYFPEQQRRAREGAASVVTGAKEVWQGPTKTDRLLGGLHALGGAVEWATSPVEAGIHTFAGAPLERATGIPSKYTDFAASLAIPFYGLPSLGSKTAGPTLDAAQRIFSPDTVSPLAQESAASIRKFSGQAARDYEQTSAAVEQFRGAVNQMPDPQRLDIMHYLEGGNVTIPPEVKPLADTLRTAFEARRTKLERLYPTMNFIDDYFPHMWKDPQRATQFADQYAARGPSRQGSGASLKARTVPTIEEGIRAGLEPISTDPIELALRYTQSMDHFIAAQEMLEAGKQAGHVIYIRPKTMGASGRPDSFKVPDGYVPVKGRGATRDGAQAYAPEDWARVYNNYINQGWHKNADFGLVLDRAQRASNGITALELALSGYHAFTMANEAFISQLARGLSEAFTPGQRLRAIGTIPTAFAAPATSFMKGRKGLEVYLGRTPGTPDMRKVMDLLTEAGGRAVGSRHAPDYQFSAMDNFWTAWKRGAQAQRMAGGNVQPSLAAQAKGGFDAASLQAAKSGPFSAIGQAMSTVAHPLFNYYIPRLKVGAFYDHMHSWLGANPAATHEAQVAAARKIWDSIDNRFGEMVQDNIFWAKTLKQVSTLGMRSYSWNMGTMREIGGGALSALKDPRRLSMTNPDYDPRVAYVVALPMAVGTMNAVYQYLMTGKSPESVEDLMAGRTGGTQPGFGGRGQVPERVMLPGYQKDVFGWYEDWLQEATNKMSRLPALVLETARNKDWRGDPIRNLDDPLDKQMAQYMDHVFDSFLPISLKTVLQGQKTGSNIGVLGELSGQRPAPPYLQDPVGYARGMHGIHKRDWQRKEKYETRQKRQYGGDVQE